MDPEPRWLDKYHFIPSVAFGVLLFLISGWGMLVWDYSISTVRQAQNGEPVTLVAILTFDDKFIVSRAGEAYDAQARGLNRKFTLMGHYRCGMRRPHSWPLTAQPSRTRLLAALSLSS